MPDWEQLSFAAGGLLVAGMLVAAAFPAVGQPTDCPAAPQGPFELLESFQDESVAVAVAVAASWVPAGPFLAGMHCSPRMDYCTLAAAAAVAVAASWAVA